MGTKAMTHDNVTDIVGRLRNFALNTLALIPDKLQQYPKTDPDLIIKGFSHQCDLLTEAADTIATLRKQLENAREALQKIAHLDVPRPVAVQYMPDRPSKHDKCAHDVWMYDECGNCISDFATEALKGQPCG